MNESELRAALGAIAEADPIDEGVAWAAITTAVDADRRRQRLRRTMLGGAGLVVAAAAAALVVVALGDDPRPEAVEVVPPATEPTTATSVPADATTTTVVESGTPVPTATSGPVPEHPLLVQRTDDAGVSYLLVVDADSGELLGTPAVEPNFSINDPVIGPDGTIYFTRETGDTSHIEVLEWGSSEPGVFRNRDEASSPAISPDGSTFAYVEHGVTIPQARIVLVDVASGQDIRRLEWRADDPDFFHTAGGIRDLEWSPDGTRLLFISSYEGSEALVIDADAESLSDATRAADLDVLSVGWSNDSELTAVGWCCFPDYEEPPRAYAGTLGALEPVLGDEEVADIDGNSSGELAIVAGGGVTVVGTDGQRRDVIGLGSGVFSAEIF